MKIILDYLLKCYLKMKTDKQIRTQVHDIIKKSCNKDKVSSLISLFKIIKNFPNLEIYKTRVIKLSIKEAKSRNNVLSYFFDDFYPYLSQKTKERLLLSTAYDGNLEIVKKILEHSTIKTNINCQYIEIFSNNDFCVWNPLSCAIYMKHQEIIDYLLSYKDICLFEKNSTDFEYACLYGNIELVKKYVLKFNKEVNKHIISRSVLWGCEYDKVELFKLFYEDENCISFLNYITDHINVFLERLFRFKSYKIINYLLEKNIINELSIHIGFNHIFSEKTFKTIDDKLNIFIEFLNNIDKKYENLIDFDLIFQAVCSKGFVTIAEYCLNHEFIKQKININEALNVAFKTEQYKFMKWFLLSKKYHENFNIKDFYNAIFFSRHRALRSSKINMIKFLLTNPELELNLDIRIRDNELLFIAAFNERFDFLDYLISSPELKTKLNINLNNNLLLRELAKEERLSTLKQILEKYSTSIDASDMSQSLFELCAHNSEMVDYLIFDYKIEINKELKAFIKNKSDLEKKIMKRELIEKLNKNLIINLTQKSLIKI